MKIISTNKNQKKKRTDPRKEERAPRAKPVKKWDITANLINNIWDAWIVTDLKFKVLTWNTAAEKIYGWKQDEILNQPLTKFINTEYLTGTNSEDALQQVLEHGHWQGEVTQNRKDGSRFTVMASVSLIKDDEGKSVGFVAINRDITESKRVEEKLLQYKNWTFDKLKKLA
jgi:PAS domain S-box-containing protein